LFVSYFSFCYKKGASILVRIATAYYIKLMPFDVSIRKALPF
jgi:hypothetical protein